MDRDTNTDPDTDVYAVGWGFTETNFYKGNLKYLAVISIFLNYFLLSKSRSIYAVISKTNSAAISYNLIFYLLDLRYPSSQILGIFIRIPYSD